MSNILSRLTLAIAAILIVSTTNAQPHVRLIAEGERDFKVISNAFYEYWEQNGRRASDYKRFKRWEEFMLPRLNEGKLPSSGDFNSLITEFGRISRDQSNKRGDTDIWTPVGPETWKVGAEGYNPGNGRVNCITVDPIDPNRIFIGAAGGGVWKSENAGKSWETTTDKLAVLGITDIYINPEDRDEIIALTGDAYGGNTPSVGLIKSTDGGTSWSQMSLSFEKDEFKSFFKLEVNPDNTDIMYVAGNGIYKSVDAGENWTKVSDENVSDLVLHPTNPSILYAALNFESNFEEITLLKSEDAGNNWDRIVNRYEGVDKSFGRKALGVTMDNPDALVVLATDVNSTFGALLKSTDVLETLELKSSSPNIFGYSKVGDDDSGQGGYDLAVAVSPENENEMYVSGVHIWKSIDAGVTWEIQNYWVWSDPTLPYVHADNHTLDFAHGNLYAGGDGGIFVSEDDGVSFQDLSAGLTIGQFYRISVHPTNLDGVAGGLQDNGSFIRRSDDSWYHIYGADGMEAIIDHTDPSIVYSETQFGGIIRYSQEGEQIDLFVESGDNERGGWVTPYVMHPDNHKVLYFGFENVWKSEDQGESMEKISDFTSGSTINILKQHPVSPEYFLVHVSGTLYLTKDEGRNWEDITVGLPSHALTDATFAYHDPETIFVTFSNYNSEDKVYASTDGGSNWLNQSAGLPKVPVNCILTENSCAESAYVGTDIGVFYKTSTDSEWLPYGSEFPNVVVRELEIQYSTNTLYAATYGRGVWRIPVDGNSAVDQAMTFTSIEDKAYGDDPFALEASVDSGEEIEFVSSNSDVITINGNNAEILGAGTVTITARQGGSCEYNAVAESQEVVVNKADQSIDFKPLSERRDTEGEFLLEATATSGLGVQFTSSDNSVIFIFDNTARIRGIGTATITASQEGNENYNAATPVDQTQSIVVLGLDDTESQLNVYPNPVSGNDLKVVLPLNGQEVPIAVFDTSGQRVLSLKSDRAPVTNVDVSRLDPGIYIIKVQDTALQFIKEQ